MDVSIPDYDRALYYMMWGEWDNLLVLMVRTKDDILSKRIQDFLHAFHYATDKKTVLTSHDNLLYYLDHAMKFTTPATYMNI